MDYDETKEKRMQELMEKKEAEAVKEQEAETQIAAVTRKILTEEARTRLNNVKLVNRELYMQAVQLLIYMQQNNPSGKISEQRLKELLKKLSAKRETKIVRK